MSDPAQFEIPGHLALVEEANAAARSLEEQSHELQQAVAIFRLRETSTRTHRAALTAEPA